MPHKKKILAILCLLFGTSYAAGESGKSNIPLMLKEKREAKISELATHQLKRRFYPMSKKQITDLKERQEDYERYINESVRDPQVQSRTIVINPKVISDEVVLYASANFQTNVIVVDKFGNPWPIEKYGIGASDFFEVDSYLPHALLITPKVKYTKTNLTIILKDRSAFPIVFTLKEDRDKVDYTTQIKFNDNGPSSNISEFKMSSLTHGVSKSSRFKNDAEKMMGDGLTPEGSISYIVSKNGISLVDYQAWQYKNNVYVRTKGEIVIPYAEIVGQSVDNFKLYKLAPIGSIMVEQDGVVISDVNLIKDKIPEYEAK